MYILSNDQSFPPVDEADEHGLLAIGGNLETKRLLNAYRQGIFPWYNEDEPVCWWSPDPRFVLFPAKLRVSKSMKQVIKSGMFEFTMNKVFGEVITACSTVKRKDGPGTWISSDMINAYTALHETGYAISAEAWHNNRLVGGLYGIRIGKVFYGESMFSIVSNASKFAFIKLTGQLAAEGIELIDCQLYTKHLESLGAEMIPRKKFIELLKKYI